MILSLKEIIDIIIMTAAVGYIFMGIFRLGRREIYTGKFDWQSFKYACIITAPALILHELAHKFSALGYGLEPVFHAAYIWLAIGIALRVLRTGFIFFVPAYVSICASGDACNVSKFGFAMIALAGPAINFSLFIASFIILKFFDNKLSERTRILLYLTKQINLLLFVFNMLPLPGFDGLKVYQGLFGI